MRLILKFKQVLAELGIKLIYALSPQAKGNGKERNKRNRGCKASFGLGT